MAAPTSPLDPLILIPTSTLIYTTLPLILNPTDLVPNKSLRKLLSIFHCSTIGLLSSIALWQERAAFSATLSSGSTPQPSSSGASSKSEDGISQSDCASSSAAATHPLIATQSSFANAITALETAYLLSDSLFLILDAYRRSRPTPSPPSASPTGSRSRRSFFASLDTRLLLLHHAPLAALLLLLQSHIRRSTERGILIILLLLGSTLATPLQDASWLVARHAPYQKRLLEALRIAWLLAFLVFRVGLFFGVMKLYGRFYGEGCWTVYSARMRGACRVGIGGFVGVNAVWWAMAVGKMLRGGGEEVKLGGVVQRWEVAGGTTVRR